jgi:hypothetical protein
MKIITFFITLPKKTRHAFVSKTKMTTTVAVLTLTPCADEHEYKIIPFPLVAPNESFCAHCIGVATNYKKQSCFSLSQPSRQCIQSHFCYHTIKDNLHLQFFSDLNANDSYYTSLGSVVIA